MTWDPRQYARFGEERGRPFFDLLSRVRLENVRTAVDLGCGSGELTSILADRWPSASVIGIDTSPEMLAKAGPYARPGQLRFVEADLTAARDEAPYDLVFSNATLQWVDDHDRLMPLLTEMLAPGGVLAVQMPNNAGEPSHLAIAQTIAEGAWANRLGDFERRRASVRPLRWYAEFLLERGFAVDAWETTYLHVLRGEDPVLEWVKGTALRPILAKLDAVEQAEFLPRLSARLRAAYPPGAEVTIFPFRRVFFVAARP